ncbi:MAG: hypothetical protein GX491_22950 [Chloroflexi bacterium]|nr:hypothetical protein [Chloroflexota bacterium]
MKTLSGIHDIEVNLVKNDTCFFLDFLRQLIQQKSAGMLIFGFVPYLSLYTVETYKYLQHFFPSYAHSLSINHHDIIESSRMRIKLFDDSKRQIGGMFELLKWVNEFQSEWHINRHKGFLAPLKKVLQDDLGIFVYDGHIIGSTHTGLFNLGYHKGDLPTFSKDISAVIGPKTKSVAKELGSYLGQMSRIPEFAPDNCGGKFAYQIRDEKLGYADAKANKFFRSIFNGTATEELNSSLFLLLVTVNFFRYIFKNLLLGSPCTFFKLKYIMLYHVASSLEKLYKYYYPKKVLSLDSQERFQAILKNEDVHLILKQSKLRNVFVHYVIKGVSEKDLDPSANLYGLVEYYFKGITYKDLNARLNQQIDRISEILEDWLNWSIPSGKYSTWDFTRDNR